MKLLLWALIVVVVVIWLTRSKKPVSGRRVSGNDNGKTVSAARDVEPMVQCRHCGVHIPSSESVASSSGAVFCSEAHRLQHVRS